MGFLSPCFIVFFSSEATLQTLMSVRPSVCMYVCLSVCMSGLGENVIFSGSIYDKALIFCVHILYMSIYSTNILSVGLSVRLQKPKELRYLWMLSSLFNTDFATIDLHRLTQKYMYFTEKSEALKTFFLVFPM